MHENLQDCCNLALLKVLLDSHQTVTPSFINLSMRFLCQRGERTFNMAEPCSMTLTSSLSWTPAEVHLNGKD